MSAKFIMNENGQLDHASGSLISGGEFIISTPPSTKFKLGGAGVYRGPLVFSFAGGNASGFQPGTIATVAPVTINPTAIKTKSEFLPVVREGDSATMSCQGTTTAAPPTTAGISGGVEVASAGQSKAKGA